MNDAVVAVDRLFKNFAQKSEVAALFKSNLNLNSSAVGLDLELNKGFLFSNQRARTNIAIGPAFRKNRNHPVAKLGYRLDACGFYVLLYALDSSGI